MKLLLITAALSIFSLAECRKPGYPAPALTGIGETGARPDTGRFKNDPDDAGWLGCNYLAEPYADLSGLREFLEEKLVLDSTGSKAMSPGIYKLSIRFSIDRYGRAGDVAILLDPGYGLGKRAAAAIACFRTSPLSGSVGPATKIWRTQPICFIIDDEDKDDADGRCDRSGFDSI